MQGQKHFYSRTERKLNWICPSLKRSPRYGLHQNRTFRSRRETQEGRLKRTPPRFLYAITLSTSPQVSTTTHYSHYQWTQFYHPAMVVVPLGHLHTVCLLSFTQSRIFLPEAFGDGNGIRMKNCINPQSRKGEGRSDLVEERKRRRPMGVGFRLASLSFFHLLPCFSISYTIHSPHFCSIQGTVLYIHITTKGRHIKEWKLGRGRSWKSRFYPNSRWNGSQR